MIDVAVNLEVAYIYFNNDAEAFAARNAMALREFLGDREVLILGAQALGTK